jgi:hypothetical protein
MRKTILCRITILQRPQLPRCINHNMKRPQKEVRKIVLRRSIAKMSLPRILQTNVATKSPFPLKFAPWSSRTLNFKVHTITLSHVQTTVWHDELLGMYVQFVVSLRLDFQRKNSKYFSASNCKFNFLTRI